MYGDITERVGKFITLEGGEGTGKSTQVHRLTASLRDAGMDALATREPGGAPGAEDIRALLVTGEVARWEPMTEALLHYAARIEHLHKTVFPALKAGTWVVSDRYADSTTAYQGYGHGLDLEGIARLHHMSVGAFAPELTIILDLEIEDGLNRATDGSGGEDRYERMDRDFHRRLRDGFLEIARQDPDRCAVVDATGTVDQVAAAIRSLVSRRLGVSLS